MHARGGAGRGGTRNTEAGWLVAIGALFSPKHGHRGKSSFFHQTIVKNYQNSRKNEYNVAGLWVSGVLFPGGSRGVPPGDPQAPR